MTPSNETGRDRCEPAVPDRNHYFPGKVLSARDFAAEQQYFNQKRWMLNRHLFGWGVVCGLKVERDDQKRGWVKVGEGLALDCCGREILVRAPERVRVQPRDRRPGEQKLVVCLEYRECHTEPVRDPLDANCHGKDQTRHNRVRDSYEITLRPPEEVCMDAPGRPCYLDSIKVEPGEKAPCRTLPIHEYLCAETAARCPRCRGCECVVLAVLRVRWPARRGQEQVEEVTPVLDDWAKIPSAPADAAGGQQGAAGEREAAEREREVAREREAARAREAAEARRDRPLPYEPDPCEETDPPEVWLDDDWTPRRLVYSNPLLYDLIRCYHGDLPHIVALGWLPATREDRRVSWKEFFGLMVGRGLSVRFDRRMRAETLNPHTFLVAVRVVERGTGFWLWKNVPCQRVEHHPAKPGTDDCDLAVFIPDERWVDDELKSYNSELAGGTEVEITLRGSLIMDQDGRALDGDFVDYRLPTGNGTQGGDFVDWFAVDAPAPGEMDAARAAQAEIIDY